MNTFLENNKMINITFKYIFSIQTYFPKQTHKSKSQYIVENDIQYFLIFQKCVRQISLEDQHH